MNKKSGFTLIELLAVIVILAIIAVIAAPVILNIINDVKKQSFVNSSYGIVSAAKNGFASKLLTEPATETIYTYSNGIETKVKGNIELKYDGTKPNDGKIIINDNGEVAISFYKDGLCVTKSYSESKLESSNKTKEECLSGLEIAYKDPVLNGSDPELKSGMIPVVLSNDGTVTVADIYNKWYDYTNKEWANIVTVNEANRSNYINVDGSYKKGTIIPESDILTYLVWIPRYKYKIFNDGSNISVGTLDLYAVQTIEIVFENKNTTKSTGSTTGTYLTHPAFTFGSEELSGYYVGKFETTGDVATPTIKPNITSLRSINVSTMFITTQKFKTNTYGIITGDTHIMKNMEWGAVAYLSHSKYGINRDIRYNNSTTYITGCAATNIPTTGYETPGYAGCENAYNTTTGYLASTTGNITGIYDMAGGAWEYVMGVIEDAAGSKVPTSGRNSLYNSGFNGKYTCPTCDSMTEVLLTTGINFPDSRYYDIYSYGTTWNNIEAYTRGKLGDATKEMGSFAISTIELDGNTRYISSWYNDYSYFAHSTAPWFRRGGNWANGAAAGVFAFYYSNGHANSDNSFRVVFAE